MTRYKGCAAHSSRIENVNLQKEKSGEIDRDPTAIARRIPTSCSVRKHYKERSRLRICQHPPCTNWDQSHCAVARHQIVRNPKTCRSEKTFGPSCPCSDELVALPKLLVMPGRPTSKAGAFSSCLRVLIGNLTPAVQVGPPLSNSRSEPASSIMTWRTLYSGSGSLLLSCPALIRRIRDAMPLHLKPCYPMSGRGHFCGSTKIKYLSSATRQRSSIYKERQPGSGHGDIKRGCRAPRLSLNSVTCHPFVWRPGMNTRRRSKSRSGSCKRE